MTIGAGTGGPWFDTTANTPTASCSLTVGESLAIFVICYTDTTCDGVTVAGALNGAATEVGTPVWNTQLGAKVFAFHFENIGTGGTLDVSVDGWGASVSDAAIWVRPLSDADYDDAIHAYVPNSGTTAAATFGARTANSHIVSITHSQDDTMTAPSGYSLLTDIGDVAWYDKAAEDSDYDASSDTVSWGTSSGNYISISALSFVSGAGGSFESGAISSDGDAAAAFTGSSIASGVADSDGIAVGIQTGASIASGVIAAEGVGAADQSGASTATGVMAAAGEAEAEQTGASIGSGVFSSDGVAVGDLTGAAITGADGAISSDGVAAADQVGASIGSSVITGVGEATADQAGAAIGSGVMTSAGETTAVMVGDSETSVPFTFQEIGSNRQRPGRGPFSSLYYAPAIDAYTFFGSGEGSFSSEGEASSAIVGSSIASGVIESAGEAGDSVLGASIASGVLNAAGESSNDMEGVAVQGEAAMSAAGEATGAFVGSSIASGVIEAAGEAAADLATDATESEADTSGTVPDGSGGAWARASSKRRRRVKQEEEELATIMKQLAPMIMQHRRNR